MKFNRNSAVYLQIEQSYVSKCQKISHVKIDLDACANCVGWNWFRELTSSESVLRRECLKRTTRNLINCFFVQIGKKKSRPHYTLTAHFQTESNRFFHPSTPKLYSVVQLLSFNRLTSTKKLWPQCMPIFHEQRKTIKNVDQGNCVKPSTKPESNTNTCKTETRVWVCVYWLC